MSGDFSLSHDTYDEDRLCPARNFADANIYLVLANMIATIDIVRAVDEQGREIVPEHAYKSGFVQSVFFFFSTHNLSDSDVY